MDLCGGVITGLFMSDRMTEELVIAALKDAYGTGGKVSGAIIHSDRGSQYCSNAYQENLKEYGIFVVCLGRETAGIMLQWSPSGIN